jgi:hypothetical protein
MLHSYQLKPAFDRQVRMLSRIESSQCLQDHRDHLPDDLEIVKPRRKVVKANHRAASNSVWVPCKDRIVGKYVQEMPWKQEWIFFRLVELDHPILIPESTTRCVTREYRPGCSPSVESSSRSIC